MTQSNSDYRQTKKEFIELLEKASKESANGKTGNYKFDPELFAYQDEKERIEYDFDREGGVVKKVSRPGERSTETTLSLDEMKQEIENVQKISGLKKAPLHQEDVNDQTENKSSIKTGINVSSGDADLGKQKKLDEALFREISKKDADLSKIESLYFEGARVNSHFTPANSPDTKTTPLHQAIRNGNDQIIKFLIEHHADVNAKETTLSGEARKGSEPIHLASTSPDISDLLTENGAKKLETPKRSSARKETPIFSDNYEGAYNFPNANQPAQSQPIDTKKPKEEKGNQSFFDKALSFAKTLFDIKESPTEKGVSELSSNSSRLRQYAEASVKSAMTPEKAAKLKSAAAEWLSTSKPIKISSPSDHNPTSMKDIVANSGQDNSKPQNVR